MEIHEGSRVDEEMWKFKLLRNLLTGIQGPRGGEVTVEKKTPQGKGDQL